MPLPPARSGHRPLLIQSGFVAAALLLLPLWPSAGHMLLIPLPGSTASPAGLAVNAGAALIASGPIRGTLIVHADRPQFAATMLRAGFLPVSARASGCAVPEVRAG